MTTQSNAELVNNYTKHIARCLIEYMESTFQAWQQMPLPHKKNIYCSWRHQRVLTPTMWREDDLSQPSCYTLNTSATGQRIKMISHITTKGFWSELLNNLTNVAIAGCIRRAKETLDNSDLVEEPLYRVMMNQTIIGPEEEYAPEGFLIALMAVRMLVAIGMRTSIEAVESDSWIFSIPWRFNSKSKNVNEFEVKTDMATRTAFMELAFIQTKPSVHMFEYANQINTINARLYAEPEAVNWLSTQQADNGDSYFRTTLYKNVHPGTIESELSANISDIFLKIGLMLNYTWATSIYDYFRDSTLNIPLRLSPTLVSSVVRALERFERDTEAFRYSSFNSYDQKVITRERLHLHSYEVPVCDNTNKHHIDKGGYAGEPCRFIHSYNLNDSEIEENHSVVHVSVVTSQSLIVMTQDKSVKLHLQQYFDSAETGYRYEMEWCVVDNEPLARQVMNKTTWTPEIMHAMYVVAYIMQVRMVDLDPSNWRYSLSKDTAINPLQRYTQRHGRTNYAALK